MIRPNAFAKVAGPVAISGAVGWMLWLWPAHFLWVYPAVGSLFLWFCWSGEREVKYIFLFLATAVGFILPKLSPGGDSVALMSGAMVEVLFLWLLFYALSTSGTSRKAAMEKLALDEAAAVGKVRDLEDELARYRLHLDSTLARIRDKGALSAAMHDMGTASTPDEVRGRLEALLRNYFPGTSVELRSGAPRDFADHWVAERKIPLATSRDCPYECTYCGVKLVMGRGFRKRSAENVLAEMEKWRREGYTLFGVNDDTFTSDIARVERICDLLIERKLDVSWELRTGVRVDRVNEQLLRRMKAAGCIFLAFGIESINDAILRNIKKGITFAQVDKAVSMAAEAGILPEISVEIAQTGARRFRVTVLDNGPGIVRAQIPKIFAKLLYGSKFHRLRMSRGQQGIGISAAGMYGQLTTGKAAWEVAKLEGYDFTTGVFFVGAQLTARDCGPQWKEGTYVPAIVIRAALNKGNMWGEPAAGWKLCPTTLPDQLDRETTTGRAVALGSGALAPDNPISAEQAQHPDLTQWQALIEAKRQMVVPPHSEQFLLWDLDNYYCAYPLCEVSGGTGAKMTWGWAESLYLPKSEAKGWPALPPCEATMRRSSSRLG